MSMTPEQERARDVAGKLESQAERERFLRKMDRPSESGLSPAELKLAARAVRALAWPDERDLAERTLRDLAVGVKPLAGWNPSSERGP